MLLRPKAKARVLAKVSSASFERQYKTEESLSFDLLH